MGDRVEIFSGIVLRLGRRDIASRYYPDGLHPDVDEFDLSDLEKIAAKKPNGVGKLSVWDKQLITPEDANAFFEQPNKTRIVLDVDVAKVVASRHELHVYCEPAEKPLPGREAHRSIENAWHNEKLIRLEIQADLIGASKPIGLVCGAIFTAI